MLLSLLKRRHAISNKLFGKFLLLFFFSAPGPPEFLNHTNIAPADAHGPRINLTWTRPQQENGIIRNYTVFFSHSKDPRVVHTETFGADTFSYTVDVLGGVNYEFYVSAVTIKPGINASLTVLTSEYGKSCCLGRSCFIFLLLFFCFRRIIPI